MSLSLLNLLPQHALSKLFGKFASIQNKSFKNWIIKKFIKHYQVNMDEAELTDVKAYPDFNHFFIRKLKPELRPIAEGLNEIASPVDGIISQFGLIRDGRLFQAKGSDYSLHELLGMNQQSTTAFEQGSYITLYLAPKDYHRVHMPYTATLQTMKYIPGKLFSVQEAVVKRVKGIFTRNERVITWFETAAGPMAIILIGAIIVGSIQTRWHGVVNRGRDRVIQRWDYTNTAPTILEKGEELGHFKLGSTVIVLFNEAIKINWSGQVSESSTIKYGQLLATFDHHSLRHPERSV